MYNLDLTKEKYPIIIKPNLGQPILLNLKDVREDSGNIVKKLTFEALIIAIPQQSTQDILQQFHPNIFIQPVLLNSGDFAERRGERYPIDPISIRKIKKMDFRDQTVLNEEECEIWDIYNTLLQIDDVFGKRTVLYVIEFQVKNLKEICRIIQENGRNFLLFDIVHDLPNRLEDKINYHSIAIFNKDWKDFKFIHATDFHIARRNDFMIKYIKERTEQTNRRIRFHKKNISKIDTFISSRDFKFREEYQDHRLKDLRVAKYNFNYNLRLLIEFINKRVEKNELDFVLMTGDLIDYIQIARGNYQYENNFLVFLEILLGINRGLNKPPYLTDNEFVNKQEIMVPVFTIVGNHDYRKGHYSIRAGGVRKIFGFTRKDIKGYHDIRFFNYFKALRSKDKYLRDYFRYINPNLNYKIKIGDNYSFIFIDTGHDSIADMHDLLSGSPSTKGLRDYQIDLLRTYIQLSQDEKIVISMHTPPVSPHLGLRTKRRLRKNLDLDRKIEWSDLYEDNLRNKFGEGRLEKLLNLKYQTIMYNWATLLRIFTGSDKVIRRKVDLILCGHTHTLKEFRLKEVKKQDAESINLGYLIAPIYINVPCEVYTSKYRDTFKTFKDPMDLEIWYDVHKPFIFQTQAMGPISYTEKFKPPGFRYIHVENNQISRVNVYSIHLKEYLSAKEKEAQQELGLI